MRMPHALLLAALPSLALGQAITVLESSTLASGGRNDGIVNIAECLDTAADSLVLTWPALSVAGTTRVLKLFASSASGCPDTPTPHVILDSVAPETTSSGTISVRTLATGTGLSACNTRTTMFFCAKLYEGTTVVANVGATGSMAMDGVTPGTPTAPNVTPGDGALNVSWGATTSATTYLPRATPATGSPVVGQETSSTSQRLSGLTNNLAYQVRVRAFSEGGNPSGESLPTAGTPQEVDDFWKRYQRDGGAEQGGCGGSGGLLALLALLPLARRRRKP